MVTLWRLSGGIALAMLSGVTLIAAVIALLSTRPGTGPGMAVLSGWAVLAAGTGALVLFWPPVRYRHTSFRVDAHGLRIRSGVLWRSEVLVPHQRVQHTDVSQGPFERSLGLATLVVYTAGTQHASITLGGLGRDTAYRLRDFLLGGSGDDAV